MREKYTRNKEIKQLKSILLVFLLVATYIVVVIPLTTPNVSAQIVHLESAAAEDWAGPPMPANIYDLDPTPGVVEWDPNEDHIISHINGYTIEAGMTLNIPILNYWPSDPDSHAITFKDSGRRIDVFGTLITNGDLDPKEKTYTAFLGGGLAGWDGIYFYPGSQGRFVDVLIKNAVNGVVFGPGSTVIPPGIGYATFEDIGAYGLRMDGASGYTSIWRSNFYAGSNPKGISLDVANGSLDMDLVFFGSHGPGLPLLRISDASVNANTCWFNSDNQTGNGVLIKGNSNETVLDLCDFWGGAADEYYIQAEGSSNLIADCKFDTSGGALTIIANDDASGIPAHPVLLNPTSEGPPGGWTDSFDNSTMNATGNSSVILKWYMDVYVDDPNGDPIVNAPVLVNDSLGNPAEPPSKYTEDDDPEPLDEGWARGFVVTELIQYNDSVTNFNPFNVSAEAFSMKGYANPEPMMNMSKRVYITVPFNPNNILPIVSWITTPVGVQSGLITIQYRLIDPNPYDDGSLSVEVFFSVDPVNMGWTSATKDDGDPTTGLNNDTVYTFVWDSASKDLEGKYNTTVYIKIVPYDGEGDGTSNQTDNFTVDNEAPMLISGPTVTVTNTTATIVWEVHEPSNATVWYGLKPYLTLEAYNNSGTVIQWVTLTNLEPGRNYTYVFNSTDLIGNEYSSYGSINYYFETEVHIQLYEGWNMISVPPGIPDDDLGAVLAPIAGDWDTVWSYYTWEPDDPWKLNDTNNPSGSDLYFIFPGYGVWIHMINDAVLILDHDIWTGNDIPIAIYHGWNFIGYPSATTRPIDDALSGVQYDVIKTYDAATDQWYSYDGSTGDLDKMEMGRGYWIYATEFTVWSLPYAE